MSDYGSLKRHKWVIPLEIIMAFGAIVTFFDHDYKHFLVSIFTLSISFLPIFIERWTHVRLPVWLQTSYVIFLFASMFVGEVWGMYAKIWPWDDVAHFSSGVLMALAAVLLLAELQRRHKLILPVWLQGVMVMSLSLAAAGIWEITEFTSDQLFGTFSQGADLKDTMMDLVYDSLGALFVAVSYVLYLKKQKLLVFSYMIDSYLRLNKGG